MRKLIYSMGMSLDGYISGPHGEIDWTAPDEALHRFHNQRVHQLGAHLLGRRLYEVMLIWETTEDSEWTADYEREFAGIWRALPKIVFSRTLDSVQGNARLAAADPAEEVAKLKAQEGKDLAVGGSRLASAMTKLGLIDEYEVFIYPTVVGDGKPFFTDVADRIDLNLVESRTFGNRVVYLRYQKL